MRSLRLLVFFLVLSCAWVAPTASAEPLPEIVWTAAKGRSVRAELASGLEVTGHLLAFDASSAAIEKPDGTILSLSRADVVRLVALDGASPAASSSTPAATAPAATASSASTPAEPAPRTAPPNAIRASDPDAWVPTRDGLAALAWNRAAMETWLQNEARLSAQARDQLRAAQSRYKGMMVASNVFAGVGAITAIAGAIPAIAACPSVGEDTYEGIYVAPQVCGSGVGVMTTGLVVMLGPGIGLNVGAKQQIPAMERIIARDRQGRPARLGVDPGVGYAQVRLSW